MISLLDQRDLELYARSPTTMTDLTDTRQYIIAFKAGRAFRREGTNFVDPSPEKGAVILYSGDDDLMHFIWKNRTSNEPEEVRLCLGLTADCSC
jgi:hypothetical protein